MKRGLALLVLLTAFGLQAKADGVRLGIVSDPELRILADQLTANLSGEPSMELVERDEMRRIVKEQNFARTGFALAETIRLGQMVRAGGILVLRVRPMAEGSRERRLEASLLATGPGILLASYTAKGGKEGDQNVPDFAKVLGELKAMVMRGMPKVRLSASEPVPLSLAHIKVGFATGNRRDFEERINTFMVHRLAAEPRFLVLERHNLELLAWEKDSTAGNPEAFRTGAAVLSGEVIEDLGDPESVTFVLKIQPPGGAAVERRITGKKAAIEALGEAATAHVREYFNQPVAGEWNSEEEGKRFVESARRARAQALDWRFVKGHADAAWALGYHQEPALRMKLMAQFCAVLGFSYEVYRDDGAGMTPDNWERLERDFPRDAATLERQVDAALETIGLFHSELTTLQKNKDWRRSGIEVAHVLSHFLYQAYKHDAWASHQQELDQVRTGLRKMLPILITPDVNRQKLWDVEALSLKHSAVWNESAAEAIQAWREMFLVPRDEMKSSYASTDQERLKLREMIFERADDDMFAIAGRETKQEDFQAGLLALAAELRTHKDIDNRVTGFLYLADRHALKISDDAAFDEAAKLFQESFQSELRMGGSYGRSLVKWMRRADAAKFGQFTVDWTLSALQQLTTLKVDGLRSILHHDPEDLNATQAEALHKAIVAAFLAGSPAVTDLDVNRALAKDNFAYVDRPPQTTLETSLFWPAVQALEKCFPALKTSRLSAVPSPAPAPRGGGDKFLITRMWPAKNQTDEKLGTILFSGWDSSPGWIACGDDFWFQLLIPSLEVIRLRFPGMEEERFPLPRPTEVADATAFASLSLSSVSDRWIVMRRPGRVADWRLLVYDLKAKSWAKRGNTPCLTYQNIHGSLIIGDWFYSSYEDWAAGPQVAGLLRVHLTDGAVEFLTNSAGRGTLVGTNPPKLRVSRLAEIEPGVLLVLNMDWGDWILHTDTLTWEKFKGTPPPDPRSKSGMAAQVVSGPAVKSDSSSSAGSTKFLLIFDPDLGRPQRIPIDATKMPPGGPAMSEGGWVSVLSELPSGLVIALHTTRGPTAPDVASQILFLPRAALTAFLKHFRETQPSPYSPQLTALPENTTAAFLWKIHLKTTLFVRDASGKVRAYGSAGGSESYPSVSPDGKRVAFTRSQTERRGVMLLDSSSGKCERIWEGSATHLLWSPSGDRLLLNTSIPFKIIDLSGEPKTETVPRGKGVPGSYQAPAGDFLQDNFGIPRWSPDGHFIAFNGMKDKVCQVFVVDLASGAARCVTTTPTDKLNCSWSPDGKQIAFALDDGGIGSVTLETGEETVLLAGMELKSRRPRAQVPPQVAWSPDGTRISYWSCIEFKRANGILTLSDRSIQPIEPGGDVVDFCWLNDGTALYTISGGEAKAVKRLDPVIGKRTEVSPGADSIDDLSVSGAFQK